jgi:SAM-dependent methyltransferase
MTDRDRTAEPWQLEMLSRSLKKRQKLRLLLAQIGEVAGKDCLLVTHGDNNGALNYRFRERGGRWVWMDTEGSHLEEMAELLGEPVLAAEPGALPAADGAFDVAVAIDVHEHLADPAPFVAELARVARPGGTVVVTTPNGDRWKPVTLLKQLVGMDRRAYGHEVLGYNVRQHRRQLEAAGLRPVASGSYSKAFTELIELAINFAYVKVLSRKARRRGEAAGGIAPATAGELRSVGTSYRLYRAVFPLLRAVSVLDVLLFPFTGYAVSVVARKEGGAP